MREKLTPQEHAMMRQPSNNDFEKIYQRTFRRRGWVQTSGRVYVWDVTINTLNINYYKQKYSPFKSTTPLTNTSPL